MTINKIIYKLQVKKFGHYQFRNNISKLNNATHSFKLTNTHAGLKVNLDLIYSVMSPPCLKKLIKV